MKLIKQSFEILEQTDFSYVGIKKFIEKCGRVCYKSESNTTDVSYIKFVENLIKRDHSRPLEFGTVHLKIRYSEFQGFMQALYSEGMYNDIWMKSNGDGEFIYITTNYRYYLDILKRFPWVAAHFDESDNEYYPKRHTVHFITNRVTMDSFRTHVALSHLGESTRYCNYSKGKFNNELTFIIPYWTDAIKEGTYNKNHKFPPMWGYDNWMDSKWFYSMCDAEETYLTMVQEYLTPQQARDILPLGVKSELISCGFEDAWDNFFYRRCDKAAHPMARELACNLKNEFIKRGYTTESIAK